MTLQWILVYRQPARTRVVRDFAIAAWLAQLVERRAARGVRAPDRTNTQGS